MMRSLLDLLNAEHNAVIDLDMCKSREKYHSKWLENPEFRDIAERDIAKAITQRLSAEKHLAQIRGQIKEYIENKIMLGGNLS